VPRPRLRPRFDEGAGLPVARSPKGGPQKENKAHRTLKETSHEPSCNRSRQQGIASMLVEQRRENPRLGKTTDHRTREIPGGDREVPCGGGGVARKRSRWRTWHGKQVTKSRWCRRASCAHWAWTCKLLMTAPGVGPVTAVRFAAAIDEVERFEDGHRVESYLGLIPGESSSGTMPLHSRPPFVSRLGDKFRLGLPLAQGAPRLRYASRGITGAFRGLTFCRVRGIRFPPVRRDGRVAEGA
jgi:hypothetical protein